MAENEFEHKVNRLMSEFEIPPSVAVWGNVEKEIRQKRRRRLLAWLIPVVILFSGTGGYLLFQEYKYSPQESASFSSINDHQKNITERKPAVVDTFKTPTEKPTTITRSNSENNLTDKSFENRNTVIRNEQQQITQGANEFVTASPSVLPSNNSDHDIAENKPVQQKDILSSDQAEVKNNSGYNIPDTNKNAANAIATVKNNDDELIKSNSAKKEDAVTKQDNASAIAPVSDNVQAKKSTDIKLRIKWGANVSIGRADVVQGLFNGTQDKSSAQDYAVGGGMPGGRPLQESYATNPVNAGPSFGIGITAQKDISPRGNISLAINYSLQKTTIQTGYRVDSARLFSNAVRSSFANDFYRIPSDSTGQNNYNNSYHFIQLPVLFNYRFNNRKKLPLYLNTGVAVGMMVNAKGLVYDKNYGVFYSDNNLYKKFQLNFIAGMSAKINFRNTYMLVGPQLQYSATNLLKNKSYFGQQHLFNYGIQVSFFMNKK